MPINFEGTASLSSFTENFQRREMMSEADILSDVESLSDDHDVYDEKFEEPFQVASYNYSL